MSADFLLELLSEEIPARMQAKARADLARLFAEEIGKAGLTAASIETHATPRRLALIARGLPLETAAVSEEVKGPRAGAPPQALEGFLRKTGLSADQLVDRGGILFAVIEKPGRATAAVLAEAVPAIVRGFPWPKSMRWGVASASTASLRWVRPLKGIVAILGQDVVPLEIDGLVSGAETVGHRFHHPGIITIGGAHDYAAKLRACHVILDADERAAIIREGAAQAAAAAGLTVAPDEGLVAENAGLTEWPVPLLGAFDPDFLGVPPEVIQLTMRTNQKYFACLDAGGKLAPNFICTANIEAADGGAAIVAGNRKVLAARLADARFFWEQDLKVPLAESAKKLEGIVFHEKLGTVADKVERVAKLARWLAEEGIVPGADPVLAEQAARLAKADLVTGMVGEFPELQGVMGGYYARAEGLPAEVADAIRDHYKPVGQGDEVPTASVTVAVSLADKLDSVFAFFAIDEAPSGSRDPFALRRSALAIIRLIVRCDIRMTVSPPLWFLAVSFQEQYARFMCEDLWTLEDPFATFSRTRVQTPANSFMELAQIIDTALERFSNSTQYGIYRPSEDVSDGEPDPASPMGQQVRIGAMHRSFVSGHLWFSSETDVAVSIQRLLNFLADRLKVQQRDAGVRHDLIDAIFALGGEDDFVRLLARVAALQSFVGTGDGANLLAGYRRAANILKKEGYGSSHERSALSQPSPEVGEGFLVEPAEAALISAVGAAEPLAAAAIAAEDFEGAMQALASLRQPIDAFFEQVTVNDADPAKRAARLGLLARVRDAVHRVADFSKIEG